MTESGNFIAGQRAFRDGLTESDNPHPPRAEPESGDNYPGPFHNWRDGWRFERALANG